MTQVLKPTSEALSKAAELIKNGEVVAFPTETVYGLGADARNPEAINKIFAAKGRPQDNPLIVHIAALTDIDKVIEGPMPPHALKLAKAFWPGPLTMILPKGKDISLQCTARLDSVGVRLPANETARALIRLSGAPIAAPSANTSGKPSPTCARHVLDDMDGRIPLILDGGACRVGVESTVIDARTEPVRILRPGGVTPQMICDVLGEVEVDGSVLRPLSPGEVVRSPGMKYRHYAPEGKLTIVKGEVESVASKICTLYDEAQGPRCILAKEEHLSLYGNRDVRSLGSDAAQAASRLFDLLRLMDDEGMSAIFSEALDAQEMGLAVMNRLGRAAAFNIIEA